MELIGRGQFSTVYRKNSSTVLIKSTDPVKECMALGWFPSCRLFPKIKRINCELYESKYYPRVRSLKNSLEPKQWELYKALRGCMSWKLTAEQVIKSLHPKFRKQRDHLLAAINALYNYGDDVCFEISPRNVTVHKGKLILLDCFFMKSHSLRSRK